MILYIQKAFIKWSYRQVGIYFIFEIDLKIGIDPVYDTDYLIHSKAAIIYIYAVINPSLICTEL